MVRLHQQPANQVALVVATEPSVPSASRCTRPAPTVDAKYRDQLIGTVKLVSESVGTILTMDELLNRPGAGPLLDLLQDPRAAVLQDVANGREALNVLTQLCQEHGLEVMRRGVTAPEPANQVPLAAATDPSICTPANSSSGLSGVAEHVPVVVPVQMSAAPAAPAVAAASATSTLPTASAASDDATEHVASTTQQTTLLLTVDDLPAWRESWYGSHKEARALLQQLTRQPEADVIDLEMIWENWQAYIAKHPKSEEIVGSGIVALKAKRIPNSSDPNNFGAKRLDFFVYRLDGSAARLHPGTKRTNDAAIVNVPAQVLQNTLETLRLIPQIDRLTCQDAFNCLTRYPLGSIVDLTDGSRFPWPRFIANLGRMVPDIMGTGSITNVRLADVQCNKVILELTRSDEIRVRLSLVRGAKKPLMQRI